MEWVELAVREINIKMAQPAMIPPAVGPTNPLSKMTAAVPMTIASKKYNVMATGERCPLKNLSEIQPERSDPATAAIGIRARV